MRRICYSVAMSLDGYVAGPNGESDWIIMDPEIDFGALMSRFDTILMGRRSWEAAQSYGGGGMPGMRSIVVSSTLRQEYHPDLTVVNKDLAGFLARLRAEPGKDIWLFGGGGLFRSALEVGQVDAVEVAIVPVLLGGGVPLLPECKQRTKLKLTKHKVYKAGIVALEYEVTDAKS